MRPFLIILLFSTICFTAQAQYSQGAKDSAQNEIRKLADAWNQAIVHRDSLALDRILATDYSLNGSVLRSAWLNNTLHHITSDTLMVLNPLTISFYGQAARSEGMFYWKASFDGRPVINGDYAVTDIWIRRDGRWQVLIRMSLLSKKR